MWCKLTVFLKFPTYLQFVVFYLRDIKRCACLHATLQELCERKSTLRLPSVQISVCIPQITTPNDNKQWHLVVPKLAVGWLLKEPFFLIGFTRQDEIYDFSSGLYLRGI